MTTQQLETQVVSFSQAGDRVEGKSLFALAHDQVLKGQMSGRYFTGTYANRGNHHSYHGAFQFVLSNSCNRMQGRWVGFGRDGNDIDTGEWRWEHYSDDTTHNMNDIEEYFEKSCNQSLFRIKGFL